MKGVNRVTGLCLIKRAKGQNGVVFILTVLAILALFGFAGLAIDIGHLFVVRNELQTAADASALAGAGALYPNISPNNPHWTSAQTTAFASIQWNKSDGQSLVNCQVQTGYWNLSQNPSGLQSSLPGGVSVGGLWVPAVEVIVRRASGQNGPVATFFASVLGIKSLAAGAQATAVVAFPSSESPGALIPFVISKQAYDYYNPISGNGATFQLVTPYPMGGDPGFVAGQWTSFTTTDNSASNIRTLLEDGNPAPVYINQTGTCPNGGANNDCVWIPPGVKETDYHTLKTLYEGHDVLLPVIPGPIQSEIKKFEPVLGFAGFHIDQVYENGSHSYLSGHLLSNYYAPLSGGLGGPDYGTYTPPRLVN